MIELKAITVVGAGPVGLKTAINLTENGWETSVLEEHPEIGKPVQCAGLISKTGVERLKLKKEIEACTVNQVKGARIFSPDQTKLEVKKPSSVAYVINREKFDKQLYKKALKLGIEVRMQTQLIDVRSNTLFLKSRERGEIEKSRLVVGADGVSSKVRELMDLKTPREKIVQSIQARVKGNFDPNFVEMHLGSFAKGFFAWLIPESSSMARIGLGTTGENIKEAFKAFLERKGLTTGLGKIQGGLIPVSEPLTPLFKENMFLVGDAAFQTKSSTGGGLITGCLAADILSQTISEHFKNKASLTDYEKNLKPLNKELQLHWKLRRYLNSLSDKELNKLFVKLNKLKINEFLEREGDMDLLSGFLPQMLKSPKYFSLFPQALKFFLK